MRNSSPKILALYSASLICLVLIVIILIDVLVIKVNVLVIYVIGVMVLFTFIYFVIKKILNDLLYKKINPIYKTILHFDIEKEVLKNNIKTKKVIEEVNKEVFLWAENKTEEIHQLKQQEKYRKDFLGNVSHELKTPIFNIQGYVLTLLDGGLEDPKINRYYLERTEKSINRIISIVEDLVSISQLESDKLNLKYESFDIIQLVREVFEIQEMTAKSRNISLELLLHEESPIIVIADRKRILEVVNNLIKNSIIYGKSNGETTVSFMHMGENILTEIADNGIGIEDEFLTRLFERFYRIDKSRSRESGGTGLGLSIVKHIIEAHKQTINVRSTINKGSSFAFTLKKDIVKS